MAAQSYQRLAALAAAGKEETAGSLDNAFRRVLMALRKFNSREQLRLQSAEEDCFILVGTAFDMDRQILKTILMNRCTLSVLPIGINRVSVVIGKEAVMSRLKESAASDDTRKILLEL
jgi:hypothetical protein